MTHAASRGDGRASNEGRGAGAFLRRYFRRRAKPTLLLLVLAAAFGWTGSWHWFPELFSHFFLQYALLFLLLSLFIRERLWRGLALAALAFSLWAIAPFWISRPLETPENWSVRVFQFNAARNTAPLTRWLMEHREEVDLVLVLEADPAFAAGMDALAEAFPHRIAQLDDSPFGIALLSRYPLEEARTLELADAGFPALSATLIAPGGPLRVFGIHPPLPLGKEMAALRDQFMEELAAHAGVEQDAPTLVLGDFNSTVWSPQLRDFLAKTGLEDGQRGHGALGTWPAMSARHCGFAGIPIDLTLVSPDIRVRERRTIPENLPSDHLPVLTRIDYGENVKK
jgi:endonuclease/exonuclease/phosphatase (EEP) superfamily protein YafD